MFNLIAPGLDIDKMARSVAAGEISGKMIFSMIAGSIFRFILILLVIEIVIETMYKNRVKNYKGEVAKIELLREMIPDILENGHRMIIFSQFLGTLEEIKEELKKKNVEYFYIDGSVKSKERMEISKKFNSGEGQVVLISLKAGGTGLNLIGADVVIHYDPWWNFAVENQASDRAHRIGQKKSVQVIKLITEGTIEEKIIKIQENKRALSENILGKDSGNNKDSKEIFEMDITHEAAKELALRSRGTPRIANRLLKRVRDYAQIMGNGLIDETITDQALSMLDVDHEGLDYVDQKILRTMIEMYGGGPVGLGTLSVNIAEERETVEDMYEPYLIQKGFIMRTRTGRVATRKAYEHLGYEYMEK